ncbi:MAG: Na/Pi cotransporter family protein, partial [Lachnospiraceae bacterium]
SERFLRNPDIALAQVHTVMNGMAKKSRKNVLRALKLMDEYSEDKYNKVQERENLIDKYEDKLGTYLMQVTARELNRDQIRQSSKYLHTVSDFERIADHACGISRVAKEIEQNRIHFSEEALNEIKVLKEAVMEIMEMTVVSFRENDLQLAKKVEPLRITIRMICGKIKKNHIIRLQTGNCEIDKGFAFNDLISNLERISAHCSNVAVAMIEFECDDFNTHEYLKEMRSTKDLQITRDYNYYQEKYSIESSDISKEKIKTD